MTSRAAAVHGWLAANPALRRLELASFLWSLGEYVGLIGLLALAYAYGGPGAVAALTILQAAPSVVLAPLVLGLARGLDRDALLRRIIVVRVAALAAAVVAAPVAPVLVFALAAIDAIASTLLRPVRATLTPALARTPEELVATNVTLGTGASAAGLAGPAAAGVLLAVAGPVAALAVATAGMAVALVVTLGIRARGSGGRSAAGTPRGGRVASIGAATRHAGSILGQHPEARVVVGLVVGQRLVRGMVSVLIVALAIEGLGLGDEGVGFLSAALGLGSLLGAIAAATLVRRTTLAGPFAASLALWGAGLLAGGAIPAVAAAAVGLAIAGVGRSVFDVAWVSILQRTVPAAVRSTVLGLLESLVTAALAAGSVIAAALVAALGPGGAMLVAGAIPVLLAGGTWRLVRSLDDHSLIPERELALLRGVPLFQPLPLTALEAVAAAVTRRAVPAGGTIVTQGEPGDCYYLVDTGLVEVRIDDRVVRTLGPGEGFGEIALLRDVPRTATVRAVEPTTLLNLDRGPFIAAVTGSDEAGRAADEVIRNRMGDAASGRPA